MCWNMPNGKTCKRCQILFDNCTHTTSVDMKDGKGAYCVFCEKRQNKNGEWKYESTEQWTHRN